ncbi:MAG TPA: type II secretion system F family protein [Actinomycetota bacterium]|nr:type II secretion system F family protein [Actinomycetota bacterium]
MPRFKYVALAGDDKTVKGSIEAGTAVGVRTALEERELRVVSVKERRGILQLEITRKKVPRQEIIHFSRQLAAFVRAGIPILQSIQTFSRESGNKTFKRALDEISDALRRGDPLSRAVAAHGHSFPRFYVDMLKAAELTGRLDAVLDQLALYIERDLEARRRIRSALAYPGIIGVMSLATIGILTVFVLPRFQVFFKSLNATLPLPTRMVLAAAGFLGHWWWAIGAGAALVVGSVYSLLRTEAGRRTRDTLVLRLPAVASVVRYSIVERFCRILSSMVGAGVPLPEAMVVVSESTGNAVYERALARVREEMLEGEGIAAPITRTDLFPGVVTQMIRVGEDTGTLDQQLATAALFYEKELDYKVKKLTTYFEPAMIIFMGLVVGFVAIALVSAMYGIFRQSGSVQ